MEEVNNLKWGFYPSYMVEDLEDFLTKLITAFGIRYINGKDLDDSNNISLPKIATDFRGEVYYKLDDNGNCTYFKYGIPRWVVVDVLMKKYSDTDLCRFGMKTLEFCDNDDIFIPFTICERKDVIYLKKSVEYQRTRYHKGVRHTSKNKYKNIEIGHYGKCKPAPFKGLLNRLVEVVKNTPYKEWEYISNVRSKKFNI